MSLTSPVHGAAPQSLARPADADHLVSGLQQPRRQPPTDVPGRPGDKTNRHILSVLRKASMR
jgi:hypothetical protein